ncbi:MAG: hypothetical protein WC302_01370 [Candidatus Paceibacterota bacterium]|jgi:hypothetical protein
MGKIHIQDFINSLARITLSGSVVEDKNRDTCQKLFQEQAMGAIEMKEGKLTEMLIAEIFVCHIPLSLFLSKKDKINILDDYYIEIYKLLKDQYRFLNNKIELEIFEDLLQERYKEYYPLVKNATDENWVKIIAKKVAEILAPNHQGLLQLALSGTFTDLFTTIDGFVEEASSKFDMDFNNKA